MNIDRINRNYENLVGKIREKSFPLKEEKDLSSNKEELGVSFKDVLTRELDKVNKKQIEADILTTEMIMGEEDDLHKVIIATDEAKLTLELAVQVKNRCIEAFKEINNIQL